MFNNSKPKKKDVKNILVKFVLNGIDKKEMKKKKACDASKKYYYKNRISILLKKKNDRDLLKKMNIIGEYSNDEKKKDIDI